MGLFKSYSEKEVKRVQPIVNKINSLEPEMEKLSDAELRAKTDYFKDQLAKEFTNINSNFIQTRKLLDDIVDELKEKVSYQDLKILEKNFAFKLESLHVNVLKKFVEKSETIKNFKHIEHQIRSIYELIQKRGGDNENWLIAKKPLNSNLCASCESYLGDLKNNNPYVPWNKYPLKDSNDKSYRYGSGYSKMLQMINIEENDKKNMSSFGIGMNFREELGNIIKKNEKNDFGDFNSDLNNNINFNKTMGNFSKSPKNNFPSEKKLILLPPVCSIIWLIDAFESIIRLSTIKD